jgi:hypothetical protein
MMTCESSTKLRSTSRLMSSGVEIEVCAPASNNVYNIFQERHSERPTMRLSKRLPDPHKGKLAEGATSQREATESGRIADSADR